MTVAIEVLRWLAAQVEQNFDFRPSGDVTRFLPTRAKLLADANLASTFTSYLAELQTTYRRLDADGTIGRVERASALNVLVRNTHPVPPIPGLPNNTTQHFDDRLILDSPDTSASATATAYALVKGDIAPSSITTAAAKADALIQMRRLDNIFIRLDAAKLAQNAIQRPIEELMALYRVEGNLGVPPSSLSLDRMIPSDTPAEPSSMPFYPKSGSKHIWPHLVWLGKDIIKYGGDILDVSTDGDRYKEPAIIDWALQLCGLDELQELYFIRNNNSMRDIFIDYSDLMWTKAGISGTNRAAAGARWDALVSNLVVKEINVNGVAAVSVTPSDPAKFVAGILAEAQAQVLASAEINLAVTTPVRSSMLYLLFHAHAAHLSLPVLTRALLEVHVTKPAAYTALFNEIEADSDLVPLLNDVKHIRHEPDNAKSRAALHGLDIFTSSWLSENEPVSLDLLTNFLETAGHGVWGSWQEHRGNMSRYMVLLDYYQRLFA